MSVPEVVSEVPEGWPQIKAYTWGRKHDEYVAESDEYPEVAR